MPYDLETISLARSEEQKIINLTNRLHDEEEKENRDPLRRDYGRVLYSSSFRRLQGKMQLLGIHHACFFRNRLTHSLEAAQIAREVASQLGLRSTIVAEACTLAHDLGNPPFGHSGEIVLNDLAKSIGGFEGNAQTFRILHHLEKRHYDSVLSHMKNTIKLEVAEDF
jgi:dGTPase